MTAVHHVVTFCGWFFICGESVVCLLAVATVVRSHRETTRRQNTPYPGDHR